MSSGAGALPPRRLLGRFDVIRRLGEGGMGVVFEAVDRESSARVALKTLRTFDAETLLYLKEEFRTLQDIRHPNLVSLGELMRDGDEWFFTMELVDGLKLLSYVRPDDEGGQRSDHSREITAALSKAAAGEDSWDPPLRRAAASFDERRLRESLAGLSRALLALHAAGKVHRDIKPSNVMVAQDGRVVLLDFGLVTDASRVARRDDAVVGSVHYMAPEQAANEEVGPAADWYSVGVVLYECLTGHRPFEGSAVTVLTRKVSEEPRPPSSLVDGIPDDLEALCMELLRLEAAERPAGGEVLRRLSAQAASDRPTRSSAPPPNAPARTSFVGRSAELARLADGLAGVDAGEPATLVVVGESGIGKSAMVRRFTEWVTATRPDTLILYGRCYELEAVPYKALDGVMDEVSRFLAPLDDEQVDRLLPGNAWLLGQVFPVLRRVAAIDRAMGAVARARGDVQETRLRLFATVREFLTKLGELKALVLVIDDLHWADADSIALLTELLRPPLPPRMLLVGTARPYASLARLPGEVVVSLERLPAGEALELARRLLSRDGPADDGVVESIAADAGGHPLFVDELVRHARNERGPRRARVNLDEALASRVRRLADAERELLEVLAVAGVALPHPVAIRASGLDVAEFAKCAAALRAAHLARSTGLSGADSIEPYHDRVRESVVGRLDAAGRRAYHARIATAFESARGAGDPDVAETLAMHWLNAGHPERASVHVRRAADAAFASLAFQRAAQLYERALGLPSIDAADPQAMRIRRAQSLANAGRSADAGAAFREAAAHATGEQALELRRRSAEELLVSGRVDEGMEALGSVIAQVGMRLPPGPITTVLLILFFRALLWVRGFGYRPRDEASIPRAALAKMDACWSVGRTMAVTDHVLGAYFQLRLQRMALRWGEPLRLTRALAFEAAYLGVLGHRSRRRSERLLEKVHALARQTGHPHAMATVIGAEGFVAFMQGRNRESVALAERALATVGENTAGFTWEAREAKLMIARSLCLLGEIKRFAAHVRQAMREAEDRGDLAALTVFRTGLLNFAWLRTGDSEAARAVALDAARGWTQRGYYNQHYWIYQALLEIDIYEGKGKDAHERVVREWPRMRRALVLQTEMIHVEALYGRGRAAVLAASQSESRQRERLVRLAERDAKTIGRMRSPSNPGYDELLRAGVASVRGDMRTASAALERAVLSLDAASAAMHAAAARRQIGRLQGGDAGRELVRAADAWMTSQDIAEPARIADLLVPGSWPVGGAAERSAFSSGPEGPGACSRPA